MSASKFCPKCGKAADELYEGICGSCTAKAIAPIRIEKKGISICANCSTIFDGVKPYRKMSRDEIFYTIISSRILLDDNLREPEAEIFFDIPKDEMRGSGKAFFPCKVKIRARTEAGFRIEKEKNFDMTVKFIQCEKCSKKSTNYFEGVLQIRNAEDIARKEMVKERLDEIMKEQEKRSVFITNVVDDKNGFDCYVTSQRHIKEIGRKLHDTFGGELKINEQLFSRDAHTGKELFRVNVLIRLPDYSKGDVIKSDRRMLQIKSMKGSIINAVDLETGKDVSVNIKDSEADLVAKEHDMKTTTISLLRPNMEMMNPFNYQSEMVRNPIMIQGLGVGDEAKVFLHDDVLWVAQ